MGGRCAGVINIEGIKGRKWHEGKSLWLYYIIYVNEIPKNRGKIKKIKQGSLCLIFLIK